MKHPGPGIGLKLLAVELGEPSSYAKVEVTIAGQTICSRWGLDEFTYPHLKHVFQTRCFDTMPGVSTSISCCHSTWVRLQNRHLLSFRELLNVVAHLDRR